MNLLRRIYGAQQSETGDKLTSVSLAANDLMESGRLHDASSRMEAHAHQNVRDRFQERLAELVPMDWIMNTHRFLLLLLLLSSSSSSSSSPSV
eukprot:757436-Hanusia_phi.AAC.3